MWSLALDTKQGDVFLSAAVATAAGGRKEGRKEVEVVKTGEGKGTGGDGQVCERQKSPSLVESLTHTCGILIDEHHGNRVFLLYGYTLL